MRRSLAIATALLLGPLIPSIARADAAAPSSATPAAPNAPVESVTKSASVAHANPRLKLSYRRFNVGNFMSASASAVPLQGGQLDAYLISRRWFRLGVEAEGGAGDASYSGQSAQLWYGMGGLSLGFQYPARVTPFVEGRFAAGALGGKMSGSIPVGYGASVNLDNTQVATLMYVGGVDAGIELYTFGRFYLSAAIGWAHPVYQGPDMAAMQANPSGGMQTKSISADTFTFKLGIGI